MPEPSRTEAPNATDWQPRIVAFFCTSCTYTAADLAGISRKKYASNVRIVRMPCTGRVDPQFVLHAFAHGADGVLIGGCHPGECQHVDGNHKAMRRHRLLLRLLESLGIQPDRFRLEWISASEGGRLRRCIDEMVARVRELGPLALPSRFETLDRETAPVPPAATEVSHAR